MDLSNIELSEEQKAAVMAAHESEVKGLKSNKDDVLSKYASLNKKLEGLDVDAISKVIADAQSAKEAEMMKNGQFAELQAMKIAEVESQMQAQVEAYKSEADKYKGDLSSLESKLQKRDLEQFIRSGADNIKDLQQTAIADIVNRANGVWQIKDGKAQAFDGDKPILKDGVPITPDAWIEGLRESAPHYFNIAKGSGSLGGQGGGDNKLQYFQKGTENMTEQAKIANESPDLYVQLKEIAAKG